MFKTLTSAINPKVNPSDEEIEKIPSYIFCRWLSGNPLTIQAGNIFNLYDKIPILNQYKMVKSAFSGKIRYIPYPKNTTEKALKEIEYLQLHFKINEQKAKEYIELIDKKELQEIVQMYDQMNAKR